VEGMTFHRFEKEMEALPQYRRCIAAVPDWLQIILTCPFVSIANAANARDQ
jgi:hypothetical protein